VGALPLIRQGPIASAPLASTRTSNAASAKRFRSKSKSPRLTATRAQYSVNVLIRSISDPSWRTRASIAAMVALSDLHSPET